MPLTLVKEVLWRASSMLQDIAPQFNLHTEREMVDWLNDGQMALAKYIPAACSGIFTIKLLPGSLQNLETILAANVKLADGSTPAAPLQVVQMLGLSHNMGTDGVTPGNAIPDPVDRRILDLNRPNWHSVVGTEVKQYCYDPRTPRQFYPQPAIPAGGLWVQAALIVQPTRIPNTGTPGSELYLKDGASTLVISVGDESVDDLVNYICARATMKSAEASVDDVRSNRYTSLFVGSINSRVVALTGNNPNLKRLPLASEPAGQAS
ncbi:MAG: hypothetical protein IV107_16335 [Paucibacter sp.]|nr:hypothetical protein [Roseateles sp.]